MRNAQTKVILAARGDMTMDAASGFYACSENSGTTLTDKHGNFADAALAGTTATPLTTKPGWLVLNGTNSYYDLPAGLWQDLALGGMRIFAFRLFRGADAASAENILEIGGNDAIKGVLRINIFGTGGIGITQRGIGATTTASDTLGSFDMTAYNAAADGVALCMVLRDIEFPSIAVDLYSNGVFTSTTNLLFNENGGTAFPVNDKIRIGATLATAPAQFLGVQGQISRMLFHSQATYDAALAAQVAEEHALYSYEKLRALAV